ncbi:helix-turn-helix transcriptional regulator [Ancylobacter vacuolatus]|uniref:DNA-binding CsgD family transcriptional regulator n=1 Tax=Ancylobacter vacuolatus TaxID=223389 RepID=A0ABU0DIN0_9HYPH|nr:helix-turn-helix transcriptional regulator [Ancylobacter vacuolatus]MDQ0348285.1 DNA-binding CsgD family transcriptional regulator [Ancylobacter vacuolatus]
MGLHQRDHDLPAGFGRDLARVLSRIGRDDFYESVIDAVAPLIPCDFWIMARYETAAQPRILSESGMAPGAKSAYADKLWRLDPLARAPFAGESHSAISLRTLCADGSLDRTYARYLDVDLGIVDELALLLPLNERSFLALCLDRHSEAFDEREVRLASEMLDLLLEMHRQHVTRMVERQVARSAVLSGGASAEILILTANGTPLFQSEGWMEAARQAFDRAALPGHLASTDRHVIPANGGWCLFRPACEGTDALLHDARIFVLRKEAQDFGSRLDRLARLYGLTERQKQIVQLSFEGHHNASIARLLNISIGGVKNHKLRIYDKLDITSERELLPAFLMGL